MTTRSQVAKYVADNLEHNRKKALQAASAWLLESGRKRQAGYLAQDVAKEMASRGYVLTKVTSARPLTNTVMDDIAKLVKEKTGAERVEIETNIDPEVIGGVRVETPFNTMDETLRHKLTGLVEGVMR